MHGYSGRADSDANDLDHATPRKTNLEQGWCFVYTACYMKQNQNRLVHDDGEARGLPTKRGKGLFTKHALPKGTTLIACGGRAVTRETLRRLPEETRTLALQI